MSVISYKKKIKKNNQKSNCIYLDCGVQNHYWCRGFLKHMSEPETAHTTCTFLFLF